MNFLRLFWHVLSCEKGEVNLGESTEVASDDSSSDSSESIEASDSSSDSSIQLDASDESELQEAIEEAIENGASQEQVKNMLRSYTLKVNGKEFTKNIDLNDEEGLRKELQLAAAGRLAMQESAELKKLYSSEIGRLKQEPISVLRELGFSEDELVNLFANEINSYIDKKKRPKEEVEAEERQKEFQKLKKEKEELENRIKERERQESMAKVEQELESDIMSALESDPDLPVDEEVIAMVADNMLWAYENGWKDVKASDVIPTVKRELESKFRKMAKSLKSPAALKALLGNDVLDQLREERIQQAKKITTAKELKKPVSSQEIKPEAPRTKVKLSDILR